MTEQAISQEQMLKQALKAVHTQYIKQQIVLLNALKKELGPTVCHLVEEANNREICQTFYNLAQQTGQNSIEDLLKLLWEPLRSRGYDFTVERRDSGVQIHCTACPYATLYRALGGAEWGYTMFCAADAALTQAFNPHIGFKRTQTLMEGQEYCDHFYFYQ